MLTDKQKSDFKKIVLFLMDDWLDNPHRTHSNPRPNYLPEGKIKISKQFIHPIIFYKEGLVPILYKFLDWTIDSSLNLNTLIDKWGCTLIDPDGKSYRVEQSGVNMVFKDLYVLLNIY